MEGGGMSIEQIRAEIGRLRGEIGRLNDALKAEINAGEAGLERVTVLEPRMGSSGYTRVECVIIERSDTELIARVAGWIGEGDPCYLFRRDFRGRWAGTLTIDDSPVLIQFHWAGGPGE